MSQTSPPTITGSPTVPQRSDRNTFSSRVDAFVTWMSTAVSEFGAVATNVYNNAVDAYNNATAAAISASAASISEANASASATAASTSAGAPMWVSGTTYSLGAAVWSPSNRVVYRRIVAGAGTTDPSADATNWALIGVLGLSVSIVSATTQTAIAGTHYVLTNVAATTLTLPASPVSGDTIAVTPDNGLTTNVIARNGKTIMKLSEDMTINNATATVTLRYLNSSWRIV